MESNLFFGQMDQLHVGKTGAIAGHGFRVLATGIYRLPSPQSQMVVSANSCSATDQTVTWHRRLAHFNERDLSRLHVYVKDVPKLEVSLDVCQVCRTGKASKHPFGGTFTRAPNIEVIVHSGIVCTVDASFLEGFKNFCAFIGDLFWYTFVLFLHCKRHGANCVVQSLTKYT